ncbi:MAG: hypothetical protein HYY67_08245 [Thaumarchaeota archaeon]|nr:hypothetical protein [Nitrososphaerota archaeon]
MNIMEKTNRLRAEEWNSVEGNLVLVFGKEGAQTIHYAMEKNMMEEAFGSAAEVIRQIGAGEHPEIRRRSFSNQRSFISV